MTYQSRWEAVKAKWTQASLRQRELAERMGTTQSVICRLEEGGGSSNRVDTLARVATALGRHLVIFFPRTFRRNSRMQSWLPEEITKNLSL